VGGSDAAADAAPRLLVGDAALKAVRRAPAEWDLVYPLQRTRFHYRGAGGEDSQSGSAVGGVGGCRSLGALRTAVDQIWAAAFKRLGFSSAALRDACAVVVLPDQFDRREGFELLSILFDSFGFKAGEKDLRPA
jgi:hypothetical protein